MDWHGKSIRMGALVIATAVVLRLWSAGAFQTVSAALASPTLGSFLLYLETGRVVRPAEPSIPTEPVDSTEPTEAPEPQPQETKQTQLFLFPYFDILFLTTPSPQDRQQKFGFSTLTLTLYCH